jgi:hypothetical protein
MPRDAEGYREQLCCVKEELEKGMIIYARPRACSRAFPTVHDVRYTADATRMNRRQVLPVLGQRRKFKWVLGVRCHQPFM